MNRQIKFSNGSMTPVNPRKPHIAFIDGFWRVSPKPRAAFKFPDIRERWSKAHHWVNDKNYRIREKEVRFAKRD